LWGATEGTNEPGDVGDDVLRTRSSAAEVLYFGFRSPLVSVLLLGLSHWLVWTVVLKGALQKDEANQQPWPPVFGKDRPFTHAAQFADTLGSATSPPGNNQATPACS
jgi:hypothetical protein